ncbi:hypothetical protein K2224_02335 [Streptomyces sp. BHT-5-2]|uniref:hypothetical protein n=1 Tax=unclassified Streptomyces TaxID=2593676 RepID=UPI001C8D3AB9|nr:hypothetical protein [Streptomyces sp. BHT-5-2]QZL02200.1 hypothetical protein K2224_02335 [Streptomyces sp. BHT-5-2]
MRASRLRHRLAGAATVAALVGAGTLAAAPTAAAKANLIHIDKVALDAPGLKVNVTYSCDPGMHHELVANAEQLTSSKLATRGAGTVKGDKLVCDYADHVAQVKLKTGGGGFAKGDEVKVTVFYFDEDGFRYADQETIATL